VKFWEALDQILDQAGLTLYPFGGDRSLVVSPRPENQLPRCGAAHYQGLFRFEPTHITAVRDLRNPTIAGMRVRMAIFWEPRTTPIYLSLPLNDVAVRDDRDRPIAVDGPGRTLTAVVESSIPMVEMEIPIELPQRDARRIVEFKGTLRAMIPGRVESFEFDDLAIADERLQHRAGVTVTLERVRKNDDIYEVHLRVRFDDASNALESHRGWIYKNPAYVVDSSGKQIESDSQRVLSQEEDAVSIAYLFALDQPLTNYRFVYRTPTLILRQPIPYELGTIDLP
jgi:hypothetical protein